MGRPCSAKCKAKGGIILVYQSRWAQPRLHYRFSEARDEMTEMLDSEKIQMMTQEKRNNMKQHFHDVCVIQSCFTQE
jgi:hypothetical protein